MKKNKLVLLCIGLLCSFGMIMNANALTSYSDALPETVKRVPGYNFVKDSIDNTGSQVVKSADESNTYILYCSDRTNETIATDTLTKGERMNYGIAHILLNGYPTKTLIKGVIGSDTMNKASYCGTATDDMMNVWITQQAIWGFQGTATRENAVSKGLAYSDGSNTYCDTYRYNNASLTGYILWDSYVSNLINTAKTVKDPAETTLTISGGDKWTKVDNGYRSNTITINLSSNEAKYNKIEVSLNNAPEGTRIINENGEDITSIAAGITKVSVFVPEDKVKSGPKFTLTAKTTITYNSAYKYVDKISNHQPSVLVGPESKDIAASLDLNPIPDTASSLSSSIYFVGFIILLCGAGIIYANVKPKKQTNE